MPDFSEKTAGAPKPPEESGTLDKSFLKILEDAGLTKEERAILVDRPDLAKSAVEILKKNVRRATLPHHVRKSEATSTLDNITPDIIHSTTRTIIDSGVRPTVGALREKIGAPAGFVDRMRIPGPGYRLQRMAYEAAIRNLPWPPPEGKQRSKPPQHDTVEKKLGQQQDIEVLPPSAEEETLRQLASRNEKVRSRLSELSKLPAAGNIQGAITALSYRVLDHSDVIETIRTALAVGEPTALAELSRLQTLVEETERAAHRLESIK